MTRRAGHQRHLARWVSVPTGPHARRVRRPAAHLSRVVVTLAVLCLLRDAAPAADAPEPKAEPPAPAADVIDVLDKMDAAGKQYQTVRATFDYELNQTLYEDKQKRKGRLAYRAPNRLRFEFTDRPRETFVFDGRVLYHKKDPTKQLIIWEMRLPEEPAVESFEIGKIPFPLPFGQKKAAVLKHFTVTRNAAEEAKDKAKRRVLSLVPKKGTDLAKDYTRIVLWIDAKQSLPTRARLFDTSENITTVDFDHIETNKIIDANPFTRPKVPDDWEIVVHAKEGGTAPASRP